MQLNRLEMYGFKSFANKVEIEFGKGITGIVGPNGSGKSNISDAIRWVLGEQNIRNIRGNQIADVIFKGSNIKRASGVADVSLTFDNDGKIPIDFKEISVQRRIFRTGESEFYINRSRCRLKDITDLFADTGLGLGGISIISQNRVDDILKAKPEDRRIFFEETIGITKYRNRKRETLHKIDDTQANLTRAADIINELETQLKPLSIQAERTNKYNKLDEERGQLKLVQLRRKHKKLTDEFEKHSQVQIELNDKSVELQSKLSVEEAAKERLNKEVVDIEQNLIKQSENNEAIRQQMESNKNEITKLTERQDQGKQNIEKIRKNQQRLSNEIESTKTDLSTIKSTLQSQREELQNQQNLIKNTQKDFSEVEEQLQNQTNQRRECEKSMSKFQRELTKAQNEALIIDHDLKSYQQNQQSFKENETKILNELEDLDKEHDESKTKKENINERIISIKSQLNDLNVSLETELKVNKIFQVEQEKQNQKIHSLSSKLQILQRMKQNYEGFAKAPKAVLMCKAAWRSKVYGAVGELLTVPAKYATAIEVALGGNVQNIVTEDEETAKAAIDFLKREKLGRVTFLPLNRISTYAKLRDVEEIGAIGFANNLVQTDSKLSKVADFLLSRTLIVDNIDNALRISRRHNIRIVTLEGEVLNIGGSISGGFSRQTEGNIFGRSSEIDSLQSDLNTAQISLDNIKQQRSTSDDKIKNINDDTRSLTQTLNSLNVEAAETRTSIKQLEKSINEKQKYLDNLQNSLSNQAGSIDELNKRRQQCTNSINLAADKFNVSQSEFSSVSDKLSDTQKEANVLSKKLKKLEIDLAVYEQKIIRTESQVDLLQSKMDNDESELKNQRSQEKNLLKSLSESAIKLAKLNKENELAQTRYSYAKEQEKFSYSAKMEKLAQIADIDKKIRELSGELNKTKNRLHGVELEVNHLKLLLKDCEEKINSECGMRNAELELKISDESINNRLEEIDILLKEIGLVNPNAPQEFEELNTRYEFLNHQLEDLKTAKENLKILIEEIDAQIITNFLDAFEKIQKLFAEVFVKLFGGGTARLELTDKEDVLNTGVEIMVTLPNKRSQPLSVLSGGERALTVTALLFAFLKYRPSPFCILDEVDAPLDEANLVRFGSFLRELSINTQFILITHRKTTMEFLDRIYGITIEEAGISKILSIKLQQEN